MLSKAMPQPMKALYHKIYLPILNTIERSVARYTLLEIAGLLTLILLIFYGYDHNYFKYPVQIFLLAALFYRPLLSNPIAWLIIALDASYAIVSYWHPVANHKFLTAYWLWVLCFASWCSTEETRYRLLSMNARFLVMFTMLGACIQKLLSSSYMDGSFFEVALLLESYFSFLFTLWGVDPAIAQAAQAATGDFQSPYTSVIGGAVILPVTAHYSFMAMLITYWNLGAQMLLEILGIFNAKKVQLFFHCFLLFFIHTTYIAAPFVGFGWLICLMAYVYCEKMFPRLSLLYLLSLFFMIFYDSPWREVLF